MRTNKNPLQAFVMSCLVVGWGLVYVGQVKWAIRVAGLLYTGIVLLGCFGLIASPSGVHAVVLFIVLVKVGSATAAALQARRSKDLKTAPSTRFHVLYVVAIFVVTALLLGPLRSAVLGYQTYFTPSGSMVPTLAIGDYIVSSTRVDTPKVGDIVVYSYNGTEAVKRVAAVAGDTLAIVHGELIRNGENLGLFYAPPERVKKDYSLQLAPTQVQTGHVYLLGDNRDTSNDSRFIGQVALEDIRGKVTGIFFSKDRSRIGTTFH
ncbi:signal peptidase I [Pseudomonas frederiksbergensis]|uniref:Signal peptidase I n=1 Tax=Pseudomonas frederiksbergensis TaxID=104087 RepID=A0A423KBE2_9PSED|nr:signal peptidase I [Pseudomonas frederiksbergensis]RON49370.1 signal peptidase I [Pseudomonas frederiksbergensis]